MDIDPTCDGPETCGASFDGKTCPHHPAIATDTVHPDVTGADILVTAVEGGIGYWATVDTYAPSIGTAILRDRYENTIHRLTAGWLLTAAGKVLQQYPNTRAAGYIRQGDIDAEAADVIVQVAVHGEILYG